MRIELAVFGKAVLSHDEEAGKWMDRIKENEDDIQSLELLNVNHVTREEALEAVADLRKYVEINYQRK